MTYQTDKFILKCAKKGTSWYVALQNKATKETMVKNFTTQKKAEAHYGKVLGLPVLVKKHKLKKVK